MFFLFSGEGATDLGLCDMGLLYCEEENYLYGPMTILVDRIVEKRFQYSVLDTGCYGFVTKAALSEAASAFKSAKKIRLPGKKSGKETRYFFNNARALACIAKEYEEQRFQHVVAVLFRDADGTASCGRGIWLDKLQSMLDGFAEEEFLRGVPMLPKPKSEAWILCAIKNSHRDCDKLEDRSGNDDSPNSLKKELEDLLGRLPDRVLLCEMVRDGRINTEHLKMPSFHAFRERLVEILALDS